MNVYSDQEIDRVVNLFHSEMTEKHRYASFDFCYSYFQNNKNHLADNIEVGCMYLWAYLASWGMLRGRSVLLQENSPASLKGLLSLFANSKDKKVWDLDLQDYSTPEAIGEIIGMYYSIESELKKIMKQPSVTLITKIMLGVFGCIPAYDGYFTYAMRTECIGDGCGFRRVNDKSLRLIGEFYRANQNAFDGITIPVIDFNGQPTKLTYKKAKLIDMFGFTKGLELAKLAKEIGTE